MSGQNSDETRNYTQAVSTRLTPQKKEQFDAFREENQLGSAQALRQIVDRGLEASHEGKEIVDIDATVKRETLALASFMAAISFALVHFFGTDPGLGSAIGGAYILLTLIWAYWPALSGVTR